MEKEKQLDLKIGNGKYMLKEKIGKGAFGHVFAGCPVGYGEEVAI